MERIGLIAGNRKFPFIFSAAAKKKNYYIVAVAIKGDTSPRLKNFVDKIHWLSLSDFSRVPEIFKQEGITKIVMAGQISPSRLFSKEIYRDEQLKELFVNLKDKKADTIFSKIADRLEETGLELLNSTIFLEDHMPAQGTLTSCEPDALVREDIDFGLSLAKEIAKLDIGQTIAVKDKAVVAVEALEGTDSLILRAGKITRGRGFTVVKVSKPKQDLRFDVPVVGLNTVKSLKKAGAKCLAIESGKTLFIDQKQSLELAEKKGISIVAL
ncbi:MAG: UDP-2,3-diacylglucosamine diphosphatase LpxI [Candidatus Omnitrophica bacterium]|nr:UDP-2,3-diacylglucosamine diphosphatase LpxI [Candidatus Omnitrophota bacterium]